MPLSDPDAHQSVFRGQHAGRPKAVAVEHGADLPAIGKRDRGGSFPRLAGGGLVRLERALAGR